MIASLQPGAKFINREGFTLTYLGRSTVTPRSGHFKWDVDGKTVQFSGVTFNKMLRDGRMREVTK